MQSDYVVIGGGGVKELDQLPPNAQARQQRAGVPRRLPALGRGLGLDTIAAEQPAQRLNRAANRFANGSSSS